MKCNIKVFGIYKYQFEGSIGELTTRFSWNIASLKTRKEVLQWYLDFNIGGTIHTEEEISKVKKLLLKEG